MENEEFFNLKWSVRRIFIEDEISKINELQGAAAEFNRHNPKYPNWLKKACDEIRYGNMVAIGLFKHEHTTSLIGCAILSEDIFRNLIKIENIYLLPDYRQNSLGKPLLNHVETFCEKKGISRIITEVPSDYYGPVKFFVKQGYHIKGIKESRYKTGDKIYNLYKDLSPHYNGDFFTLETFGKWLLDTYYDASKSGSFNEGIATFRLNFPLVKDTSKSPLGSFVIIEKDTEITVKDIQAKIFNIKTNFIIVFGDRFNRSAESFCSKNGIILFSQKEIFETFNDQFSIPPPSFHDKSNIAGMIVPLNPIFYRRRNEGGHSHFIYYKEGTVGCSLKKGDYLLFFVYSTIREPHEGIMGYAKIVSHVDSIDKKSIWQYFERFQVPSLFESEKEYLSYAEPPETIMGIEVIDYKEIKTIPLTTILQIIHRHNFHQDDLLNYYISKEELDEFFRLINVGNPSTVGSIDLLDIYLPQELSLLRNFVQKTVHNTREEGNSKTLFILKFLLSELNAKSLNTEINWLDVGCSFGRSLAIFEDNKFESPKKINYLGIDKDQDQLNSLKNFVNNSLKNKISHNYKIATCLSDINDFEEVDKYDLITAFLFFHELPISELPNIIYRLVKALNTGGRLVISDFLDPLEVEKNALIWDYMDFQKIFVNFFGMKVSHLTYHSRQSDEFLFYSCVIEKTGSHSNLEAQITRFVELYSSFLDEKLKNVTDSFLKNKRAFESKYNILITEKQTRNLSREDIFNLIINSKDDKIKIYNFKKILYREQKEYLEEEIKRIDIVTIKEQIKRKRPSPMVYNVLIGQ